MIYGYARCSTNETKQDIGRQIRELKANGAEKIFLEYGDKFDWPDLNAQEGSESVFCYGLRDQIGILCDGTVVPCCLDHEGDLALGNIFDEDLETIMQKPRSMAIYQGFQSRTAVEELCRKCGYARRFG